MLTVSGAGGELKGLVAMQVSNEMIRKRQGSRRLSSALSSVLLLVGILWLGVDAQGLDIQSICRVKGLENNELIGMGLVTGLNGTGDSGKNSKTAIRSLAEVYSRHGLIVDRLEDLESVDSIAIVMITCEVPAAGAREGDRLDMKVSVVGDATSLQGGILMWSVLRVGPLPEPYAKASGEIEIRDADPRKGEIRQGVQLLKDIRMNALAAGTKTAALVLNAEYAGFTVVDALANRITQEFALDLNTPGEVWAKADAPTTVTLHFARTSSTNPARLMSQVLTINVDLNLLQIPARVLINREAGVLTITGDVEISPFVLSTHGMTITRITPEPVATALDPIFSTERNVAIGANHAGTSKAAKTRLYDLLEALEAMDVSFDERVEILYEMKKAGVLHAHLTSD